MTGLDADLATLRGMSQNGWLPGSGANPMSEALDRVEAEITRLRQLGEECASELRQANGAIDGYLIEKEAAERELAQEQEATRAALKQSRERGEELARLEEGLRGIIDAPIRTAPFYLRKKARELLAKDDAT